MGKITQNYEMIIEGYITKDNLKEKVTLKIDTGFTGKNDTGFTGEYDIAIPSDIAQKLGLNPQSFANFNTPSGSIRLPTGNDAYLYLSNNKYKVNYVIHYDAYPLISNNFLATISEIVIIDFVDYNVVIILK